MLTSLVAIDRVDLCAKLCFLAQKKQETQIYIEPTTMLLFYAVHTDTVHTDTVHTDAVESDHNETIVPVHDARFGPTVRAPESLIDPINRAIGAVIEQRKAHATIRGVVLCGFHQSAIVAYCTSVCVQRILACCNLHATDLPDVFCVTFGLPLYYTHPTHCLADCSHIIMHDDWYVLTPFTLVVKPVPGLCWVGSEDLVSYVCNKIESLFHAVRSQRTMRDYIDAFVFDYGDVLTTHRETSGAAPPSSPYETPSVVDIDWVDCVDEPISDV
jgi:hypothetical protein